MVAEVTVEGGHGLLIGLGLLVAGGNLGGIALQYKVKVECKVSRFKNRFYAPMLLVQFAGCPAYPLAGAYLFDRPHYGDLWWVTIPAGVSLLSAVATILWLIYETSRKDSKYERGSLGRWLWWYESPDNDVPAKPLTNQRPEVQPQTPTPPAVGAPTYPQAVTRG